MNLPIALPHERWVCEHRTDGVQEIRVGYERLGARLGNGNRNLLLRPLGIDRGAGDAQFLTDGREADRTAQGSSHGHADPFCFPGMKGSSPLRSRSARRWISRRSVRSPTSAFNGAISSLCAFGSRVFNPDWPAERNASFQPAKVDAATPSSLERASRSSPRRSRRTASIFRPELNRPRSLRPVGAASVGLRPPCAAPTGWDPSFFSFMVTSQGHHPQLGVLWNTRAVDRQQLLLNANQHCA